MSIPPARQIHNVDLSAKTLSPGLMPLARKIETSKDPLDRAGDRESKKTD